MHLLTNMSSLQSVGVDNFYSLITSFYHALMTGYISLILFFSVNRKEKE